MVTLAVPNERMHYLTLHPGTFPTKESFNLAYITSWFKKNGVSKRFSLKEIFELSTQGKCYIPSHIETDGKDYSLVSSSIILIDIDDDDKVADPEEVLSKISDICSGFFYTSSHSKEKNRYRLVFALDRPVKDDATYKYIFKALSNTLKAIGVPVDDNIQTALQRVRTATKGYKIGNLNAVVKTAPILEQMLANKEEENRQRQIRIQNFANRSEYSVKTVAELKERAEKLGYVHDRTEWESLAYSLKSYVVEGHINDEEGYDIFSILCGGNDETKYWANLKPQKTSIGRFINASNEAGFKGHRYYHAMPTNANKAHYEKVKFERYIPSEYAIELLEAEERILLKSPTGSGKTHSFVTASKQLAEELTIQNFNRFYIFTTPTIALTDQVAKDNGIEAVKGNTKNLFANIQRYVKNGGRVFSCTYDMALQLHSILKEMKPNCTFSVMVDEYHHTITDYNYRKTAIDNLIELEKKSSVKSFIGLTGTPDAILRSVFQREIHIETKYDKAPCQVWGALTYEKQNEAETLLYQVLKQKADSGKKLLVFIQNKDIIQRLHKKLKYNDINAKAITSDGKNNNEAYKSLINDSVFPKDTQIILTTTVIADGINIKNENSNYECIVFTSNDSPLFDVDILRQCANRYRNLYQGFYIFLQSAKRTSKFLYSIEDAFNYDTMLAGNVVKLLKEQFNDMGSYKLFRSSRIENQFGITFTDDDTVEYSEMLIRHNANEEKAKFYSLYRNQFVQALEQLIGTKSGGSLSVSDFIRDNNIDLSEYADEIKSLKEAAKLEKEEKQEGIGSIYTPMIHRALVKQQTTDKLDDFSKELIRSFKEAVTVEHYACLKEVANLTNYTTSLGVVKQVTNRKNIHAYKHRIEALVDIAYFNRINRNTASKEVYEELKAHEEIPLTKEVLDKLVDSIAKKHRRCKKADVKYILETHFNLKNKRTKLTRLTIIEQLTPEAVAKMFDVSIEQVRKSMAIQAGSKQAVSKVLIQNIA